MKEKIAIITLHSVKNYGSVLQAYATQCYFEKMGLDSEIIDYRRPWETNLGYWFYLNDKSLKGLARNIMYFPSKIIQHFKFGKFVKSRLHLSAHTYASLSDLKKNPVDASIYCTGSDQVWNSGWNNGVIPEYFLNFVGDEHLKISFASSFGSSNISTDDKQIMGGFLKKYNLITVRENKSVQMLKDEFGLDSTEILDPTLQMSGDFWKSVCAPSRLINEKYILLIQLNRNHDFDELAKKFSNEKGIKLIRLCLRVDQMILPGKSIVIPEVEDYVRLIRDAEYVLTDSFHAVSFCLNLEKNFYVYYPEKYSERLKSIIEIAELSNREIKNYFKYNEVSIDYIKVSKILNRKRNECSAIFQTTINRYLANKLGQ